MKNRSVALLIIVLVFAISLFAQDSREQKFVEFKYLNQNPANLSRAVEVVRKLMREKVDIASDSALKVVGLSGSKENVEMAEALFKRFDVPNVNRQIEVTIHIIEGLNMEENGPPIPSALRSTVEQMHGTFAYKNYQLLDTVVLQGQEGSSFFLSGLLPKSSTQGESNTSYNCRYSQIVYRPTQQMVEISGFNFNLKIPMRGQPLDHFYESDIRTDITIKDNQKLVLGKLTRDQTERGLFLVLTTKVSGL